MPSPDPALSKQSPNDELNAVAEAIARATTENKPVIFFMGGHVIKTGMGLFINAFVRERYVKLLAGNGAVAIHDFELANIGRTSEHVPETLPTGQFGMWYELCRLNEFAAEASKLGNGYGETIGEWVRHCSKHPAHSVLGQSAACAVPVTIHPLLGGDINHMYAPDWGDIGKAAQTDFLIFAQKIYKLQTLGGVFVCFGSAVHGPEVYLKALSMVRNVIQGTGEQQARITTAMFDLCPLPADWRSGEADTGEAGYYFRPWKTILLRSLNEGSQSHYVQGDHTSTIPQLLYAVRYYLRP
jgi:hypothetical protein